MSIAKKYGAKEFYIGQFSNGCKQGMGRLFKDNREFSGHFNGGVFDGKGTSIEGDEITANL